ncbi:CesT family type III secretion system chaperone [Hahella sp. KA22]|nr:CesT family type III secretion system chaperone [Hahella sp. KA22]QAY54827.1 CesT family type III secretion system chaperone [Hahella sp. KA22]
MQTNSQYEGTSKMVDQTGQTKINSFLRQLGQDYNLPFMKLDNNGVCSLSVDGHLYSIVQTHDSPWLLLHADFGHTPDAEASKAALLEKLLEWNFLGKSTRGATLSINPESHRLTLHMQYLTEQVNEAVQLNNLLDFFIESATQIREQMVDAIGSGHKAPTASTTAQPVHPNSFMRV